MSKRSEKDYIKFSELSLAATLIYCGYPLDHLEPLDSQRLNFCFLKQDSNGQNSNNISIDEVIKGFWVDTISVSPKKYFYILRELKSQVFAERRLYVTR